jgi:GWxTD domain-containing protein
LALQGDDAMRLWLGGPALLLFLSWLVPGPAAAQKLDKDDKRFLDEVQTIMLADEEKVFKDLKQKADRLEFQKIFWARRDPDLATPANEFKDAFEEARADADASYRVPGMLGSATDCGRVRILLGKPDEVRQESTSVSVGVRAPETWTYRDRPGQTFQGGKAVIAFDAECRAPAGLGAQLDRIAAARVVQPNIDYRFGKDGRLVKLVDLLPKDTPARALLKQPRRDFEIEARAFYLKVADGGTALVGLVGGDASGLTVRQDGAARKVGIDVVASAVAESGTEAGWSEQSVDAPVGADARFLASFKMGLKPGKYTLNVGAVDPKTGKGSLASMPIEVPDLSRVVADADGTPHPVPSAASLLILSGIDESTANAADPRDPFAAFVLGAARMHPFLKSTFTPADEISIFYQVYDLRVDPATSHADAVATLSILKDGKTPVARTQSTIATPIGGSVIGPVPLKDYAPGKYVVQLKLNDRVAKQEIVQEAPIEIAAE